MSIIRVEHMEKSFGEFTPIKDISFEINQGDVISIIGPSGTGKSTLIRAINMLDEPTSGRIYYHDECVNEKGYDLSKLRTKIGMVFQSFNLFGHKTVLENVTMAPMDLLGQSKEEATAKAIDLLKDVGLYLKRDSYPDELSGGQKQRVAIARCLAMDPEIILLDEPTSALDPTMVSEVQNIIKKLADSGKTMMIVTHEMEFAKNVANRVFYLDQGGIYEEGTPEEVFDYPKKERTIAFMKKTKNFSWDVDFSDLNFAEMLEELLDYARKNDISKKLTNIIAILIEECLVGVFRDNMERLDRLNIFIEYDSNTQEARINFYFDGKVKDDKDRIVDDTRNKILEAYTDNVDVEYGVDGYDAHISFDVNNYESNNTSR